ncbi:MAG: hypothetical protein AAB438_03265 [Patescibacteria group bacterium]
MKKNNRNRKKVPKSTKSEPASLAGFARNYSSAIKLDNAIFAYNKKIPIEDRNHSNYLASDGSHESFDDQKIYVKIQGITMPIKVKFCDSCGFLWR